MNEGGKWVEEPILPEMPPPSADRIQTEGARLIRVLNLGAHNPSSRGGFTEAVVLAEAPLTDGGTGVLVAWLSGWQEGSRTTGRGRFAWCHLIEDGRVVWVSPKRHLMEGSQWHGHHELSEFSAAVRAAAETLPARLRTPAVIPAVAGRG